MTQCGKKKKICTYLQLWEKYKNIVKYRRDEEKIRPPHNDLVGLWVTFLNFIIITVLFKQYR